MPVSRQYRATTAPKEASSFLRADVLDLDDEVLHQTPQFAGYTQARPIIGGLCSAIRGSLLPRGLPSAVKRGKPIDYTHHTLLSDDDCDEIIEKRRGMRQHF